MGEDKTTAALSSGDRLALQRVTRTLPYVHGAPVGAANVTTAAELVRFLTSYADHATRQGNQLLGELQEARRSEVALRTLRQAVTHVGKAFEALDQREDAVLSDATVREYRLLTGHDPDTDTDYLVTLWADGTAEVATKPGNGERWVTWGAPTKLTEDPS